jgi:hypothetical protein
VLHLYKIIKKILIYYGDSCKIIEFVERNNNSASIDKFGWVSNKALLWMSAVYGWFQKK